MRKLLATIGLIVLWTLAVLAVVVAEAAFFAEPPVIRGDLASIENHLVETIGNAAHSRRLGSASLVLIQDGRIAAKHGFGVANAEKQVPVKTDETLFQMASVSKAVTAWGVMKLVEDGKIALDEPVSRYLKRWQFPAGDANAAKITVRHLLTHTAAIDPKTGLHGFEPGERVDTLEEALRPVTVVGEPGIGLAYGNANYAILQLLIEEVSNQSFATFMEDAVLRPLGMTMSGFDLDALATGDMAPNFDSGLNVLPRRRYTATAAAALYATAEDMGRFAAAFKGDNPVLKRETVKQMLTPQEGTSGAWGLGPTLYVENETGGRIVGHDGGAYPSWGAVLRTNPETGNGIVLMVSGASGAINQLSHDWIYWETGKTTFSARRQHAIGRRWPAAIAVIIGVLAILGWRMRRLSR